MSRAIGDNAAAPGRDCPGAIDCVKDAYVTAPDAVSPAARILPSLSFYRRLLLIVFKASRKAKRGRYDTSAWISSSAATLRALESVGVRIEITGIDNFAMLTAPCIFIGNHMSTLETFVLPSIIAPFGEVTFVVKESLVEYPVFKYVMRSRNPIVVGRKNPREDLKAVLEGGVERLHGGTSIIIFPQTTRRVDFDPDTFNTIGVKLARRSGALIVPVALKTDAWGNGRVLKDFGRIDPSRRVHIAFGKPLRVKDRGEEEHGEIREFIAAKLDAWSKEECPL